MNITKIWASACVAFFLLCCAPAWALSDGVPAFIGQTDDGQPFALTFAATPDNTYIWELNRGRIGHEQSYHGTFFALAEPVPGTQAPSAPPLATLTGRHSCLVLRTSAVNAGYTNMVLLEGRANDAQFLFLFTPDETRFVALQSSDVGCAVFAEGSLGPMATLSAR